MATSGDPVGDGLIAKSGAAGRQHHRELEFSNRANYKKAGGTQGRRPQARPRWGSAVAGRQHIIQRPTGSAQGCGGSTEVKVGGDRDRTHRQRFRERLSNRKAKQSGAIMTMSTRGFFAERRRIVELAGKYGFPAIYFQKEFVDEGGLMSYGADFDELFRRAAVYVDKILKGAKPTDLPVQQATKFEFVINLKAAKPIGLTLSPEFLARANKVIK
jgi:ABC transporter substrate binding protein